MPLTQVSREKPAVLDALARSDRAVAYRLLQRGQATQSELVVRTGLSRPTVLSALSNLIHSGLAETAGGLAESPSSAGRRAQRYRLTPKAGVAVGVEIGRRHINIVVMDAGHERHLQKDEPVEADAADDPAAVLAQCVNLIREGIESAPAGSPVLGAAVGVPVPITSEGKIGSKTLLPAWAEVDPLQELRRQLGSFPVYISNEADLGALGEFVFGHGEGRRDLTYVKLGTGIGAGIIINGHLHRGASGIAGELGHISIDYQGKRCRCGNRGCLELYVGGPALLKNARYDGLSIEGLPSLVSRALSGDVACKRIISEAAALIGTGIGTLVNLNGPALIVLGGSLSAAGTILTRPLHAALEHTALVPAVDAVSIEGALRERWASACGGAAFVFERFTSRRH